MPTQQVILGTDFLLDDELCLELRETNRVMPNPEGGTGWHRLQIVWLYRNDGLLYEHIKDMGMSSDFPNSKQFRVIGGIEDNGVVYQEETVGFLKDQADDMRWNKQGPDPREFYRNNNINIKN